MSASDRQCSGEVARRKVVAASISAAVAAMFCGVFPVLSPSAGEQARPTLLFPFELLDTSGEGASPGQQERLALATHKLAELLAQTGDYRIVDLSAFAPDVTATAPRYACGDCWIGIARKAGAEFAVLGVVHKVSTLVSTMDIRIADVRTERFVAYARGQIRYGVFARSGVSGERPASYRPAITTGKHNRSVSPVNLKALQQRKAGLPSKAGYRKTGI